MKKFFLITCFALSASLAFSQGYFSQEEIKKHGLEWKYDEIIDYHFYSGQSEIFDLSIRYDKEYKVASLVVTFSYEGESYINFKEVLVYMDGETRTFKPQQKRKISKYKVEYPDHRWVYREMFSNSLYVERKKDLADLKFFYLGLKDGKDVTIRLIGDKGYQQFSLTQEQIRASKKIITIFMDKEDIR